MIRIAFFRRAATLALCLLLAPTAPCEPSASPGRGGGDPLVLGSDDLRIEQLNDAGYHLYIRAKRGLASVLLTESTKDPERKADSYTYRTVQKNLINGDEVRILDGKRISQTNGQYFLVDSSPELDARLGSAYHIFIPWVVVWGYSWTRSGRTFLHDGTFINIRAFAKPYADYSGAYADNPYVIRVTQAPPSKRAAAAVPAAAVAAASAATTAPMAPAAKPAATAEPAAKPAAASAAASVSAPVAPAPTAQSPTAQPPTAQPAAASAAPAPAKRATAVPRGNFMPETVAAFTDIVVPSDGSLAYAPTGDEVPETIDALLATYKGKEVDVVLCVDTTDTMADAIEAIKSRLPGLLAKRTGDFPAYRLGLVAYKDYFEEYLYKRYDFTRDLSAFSLNLATLRSGGGRDVPEAVFEALYAALEEFSWSAEKRVVILVGDAPPHPLPRGSIDGPMVEEAASAARVELDAVVGPI